MIYIKNMIITAYAFTVSEMKSLLQLHLKIVINLDEKFQKDYNDVDQIVTICSICKSFREV